MMWFYRQAGMSQGPVDARTISELLRTNVIDDSTLVRSQEDSGWHHLDETDLMFLAREPVAPDTEDFSDPDYMQEILNKTWFYYSGGRKKGPVRTEKIRRLVYRGVLDQTSSIKEHPNGKWSRLGKSALTELFLDPVICDQKPNGFRISESLRVNPRDLKAVFYSWILTNEIFLLIVLAAGFILQADVERLILFDSTISVARTVISGVLEIILFYLFFSVIDDGYSRTSPGLAAGILLIPFYNVFWISRTLPTIPVELSSYIQRRLVFNADTRRPQMSGCAKALEPLLFVGLICIETWFSPFVSFYMPNSVTIHPENTLFTPLFFFGYLFYLLAVSLLFTDCYLTSMSILNSEMRDEE